MSKPWPKVKLGEVVTPRKEFITIDDLATYKRCRVQLHAKGIVLRDVVSGAEIKTKKQQVCRARELLVAEIDAKHGGYGIVPDDLEGSLVSSHYFLFTVKDRVVDRGFLGYFLRTPEFRTQVEAQGSTNYAAIRPAHVLEYEIPLPPLEEQRRIVNYLDTLSTKITQARTLRQQSTQQAEALVVSFHVSEAEGKLVRLGEVLRLDEMEVPVVAGEVYPQVGIRSFGGGLFEKGAIAISDTSYRAFHRLFSGALVLSQVKGWEGALAICPDSLSGWFASPEYRTFRCDELRVNPAYFASVVRTEWFWSQLASATRGVGARRERTRPEQFLNLAIPMPSSAAQCRGKAIFRQLSTAAKHSELIDAELTALQSAALDRAFKGEL